MADLKTKPTEQSVDEFIEGIEDEKKRNDSRIIVRIMREETGLEPRMWGESMVGFGQYHYKYASGHEGNAFLTGFSPRKRNLTVYIVSGFEQYKSLLQELGKFKTGKACLYISKIEDVNLDILRQLIKLSAEHMAKTNP
jgi:hypothetical protein